MPPPPGQFQACKDLHIVMVKAQRSVRVLAIRRIRKASRHTLIGRCTSSRLPTRSYSPLHASAAPQASDAHQSCEYSIAMTNVEGNCKHCTCHGVEPLPLILCCKSWTLPPLPHYRQILAMVHHPASRQRPGVVRAPLRTSGNNQYCVLKWIGEGA